MNLKLTLVGVLSGLLVSAAALAQNQPLPKPVSPPLPIPGSNPPPASNANPIAPPAGGNVALPPASSEPAVAPFIDGQTIGVVRIDLKDLDLKSISDWVIGGVDELRKSNKEQARAREEVGKELGKSFDRVEKFRSAGVGRLYVVISLSDIMENRPPYLVVPLENDADPKAVEKALNETFGSGAPDGSPTDEVARTIENAVVFALPATFDRLKASKPAARPDLSEAFATAGKAQIRVALIPQENARKQLEGVAGDLPDELGGGSIKKVSRGLGWMAIAITLPADPSLKIVIQASDAADAKTLFDIVNRSIAWAADRKTGPPEELAFTQMLSHLQPKLENDRILIDLSPAETQKLAATLAGGLINARNQATRVQVANNLRQLDLGVITYATDHAGQFPKDLGPDLEKYLGTNSKQLWIDPLRPNQKKPYVYLKLADKLRDVKDASSAVMIYENHTTWDAGINVAFADGHVEWIADEKQFKSMLDQTKKSNSQAAEMPQ